MSHHVLLASGAGSAAGALGFLVVLLLLVTTALLIRNMNSRLRRLPKDFGQPPAEEPEHDDGPGSRAG